MKKSMAIGNFFCTEDHS